MNPANNLVLDIRAVDEDGNLSTDVSPALWAGQLLGRELPLQLDVSVASDSVTPEARETIYFELRLQGDTNLLPLAATPSLAIARHGYEITRWTVTPMELAEFGELMIEVGLNGAVPAGSTADILIEVRHGGFSWPAALEISAGDTMGSVSIRLERQGVHILSLTDLSFLTNPQPGDQAALEPPSVRHRVTVGPPASSLQTAGEAPAVSALTVNATEIRAGQQVRLGAELSAAAPASVYVDLDLFRAEDLLRTLQLRIAAGDMNGSLAVSLVQDGEYRIVYRRAAFAGSSAGRRGRTGVHRRHPHLHRERASPGTAEPGDAMSGRHGGAGVGAVRDGGDRMRTANFGR